MARTIRTFIAAELPDPVRQTVRRYLTPLKETDADVKWVRPESMHLTLKFLGEIPVDRQADVLQSMQKAVRGLPPFSAALCGAGGFPNLIRPRVLWIGIHQGAEELTKLAVRLNEALVPLGFEIDKRPYKAHLTLGRVRSLRSIGPVIEKLSDPFESGPFRVNEIHLTKSDLNPAGTVYTVLGRAKLEG